MKKYLSYILLAVLGLGGFTACEDVPAPYTIIGNNDGGDNGNTDPDVFIDETFATSLGTFSTFSVTGDYNWAVSYSSAQITSYADSNNDGQKENNPAESYLISGDINLTGVNSAHISFDYILRYANSSELNTNYQILITDNFQTPATTQWTAIDFTPTQGSDWDTWYTADVDVPSAFLGKENVRVALLYKANAKSATWEVKNFKMQKGKAAGTTDDTNDSSKKTLPYSETFASSLGGFTNYTTSGSGAWTIDYSTAKAAGYDYNTKVTTAGTYYLVSPEISLEGQTAVHVAYDYILRYNKGDENQQLLITTSFNESAPTEGWTQLNGTHTEGSDWSTFASADIAIPAEYLGQTIRLAFRYNCPAESGSTWEVKNFSIAAGNVGDSTGNDDNSDDEADANLTDNGIKATATSFNVANGTEMGTQTLSDGTVLTFDGGGNQNAPKFYTNGNNIRMYPNNSLRITASKKIASVYINCDNNKETIYNASGNVTATPGTIDAKTAIISIVDVNSNEVLITNTSTSTGAASQVRVLSFIINYAE